MRGSNARIAIITEHDRSLVMCYSIAVRGCLSLCNSRKFARLATSSSAGSALQARCHELMRVHELPREQVLNLASRGAAHAELASNATSRQRSPMRWSQIPSSGCRRLSTRDAHPQGQ